MTGVSDKTVAGVERYPDHTEPARGKGRWRLAFAMLVAVLLLAALALAATTGFPHEEVLWMYIESAPPTLLAA